MRRAGPERSRRSGSARRSMEPITHINLFNRLPQLVHSVFDDVAVHLPVLLALSRQPEISETLAFAPVTSPMRDLIGHDFRQSLHKDMAARFEATAFDIRKTLGKVASERYALRAGSDSAEAVDVPPGEWAKSTLRFLARYVRSRDSRRKALLANCVRADPGGGHPGVPQPNVWDEIRRGLRFSGSRVFTGISGAVELDGAAAGGVPAGPVAAVAGADAAVGWAASAIAVVSSGITMKRICVVFLVPAGGVLQERTEHRQRH